MFSLPEKATVLMVLMNLSTVLSARALTTTSGANQAAASLKRGSAMETGY